MEDILASVHDFLWGMPLLVLIIGTGVRFSFKSSFAQIRLFPTAVRKFISSLQTEDAKEDSGSSYRALCTALGATVGTGNLAGVAGAIAIGGPGAVFWMWISALLGMAVKLAEASLAVKYRSDDGRGNISGGPMYMIRNGLAKKWQPLAGIYCMLGVAAALGVGNATQVNTLVDSIKTAFLSADRELQPLVRIMIGSGISIVLICTLCRGYGGIGHIAEALIPTATAVYLILAAFVILSNAGRLPQVFREIFVGAFSPKAVTGGVIGAAATAIRTGVARGIFSNEAGMGTASIAHACAQVYHPIEQGIMGIMEVFIDTIVLCTVSALVILCGSSRIVYGKDTGISLLVDAFAQSVGEWSGIVLSVCLCCFVFATITGWGLYGMRCARFLLGDRALGFFIAAEGIFAILGVMIRTDRIWLFAETLNGLMAIPNLIALNLLCGEFCRLEKDYRKGHI